MSSEVTHRCPPEESGTMPCCNKTPFEVPRSDRMTVHDDLVTCSPECSTCGGSGRYLYADSTMNMGGIGGQVMTEGPCPGTKRRPDLTDCPVVLRDK